MAGTPGDARVVYFGNLKDGLEASVLKAVAERAGKVDDVSFGEKRRHAYVTFSSPAGAAAAVAQLNKVEVEGRPLRVEASRPPKPRTERAAADSEPAAETYDNRVVVRGLPREFSSEALAAIFAPYGAVKKARIGRGLGYVTFETPAAATAAFSAAGTTVSGSDRVLAVEYERLRVRKRAAAPAAGSKPAGGRGGAAAAAPAAAREPRPRQRVRVDGLEGSHATPDQLKAHFAGVGRIETAKVVRGAHGFVKFDSPSAAQKALTLSGSALNGKVISVSIDEPAVRRRAAAGAESHGEIGAGRRRVAGETDGEAQAERVNTIWIGGLQGKVSADALREFFSRYGSVADVELSRKGAGFAYVTFSANVVDAAVSGANGAAIGDVVLKVDKAQTRAKRAPAPAGAKRAPRRRATRRGGRAPAAAAAQ